MGVSVAITITVTQMVTFEIQGLPPNPNGAHGHWRAAAAIRKKWRNMSAFAALAHQPKTPFKKCRITCLRCSVRRDDWDNRVASFKPVIDGLVDAKIIENDTEDFIIERFYLHEKTKKDFVRVRIIVEEIL